MKNKYTSPAHLAGEGGSAGGITVGGALTQRPDLFASILLVMSQFQVWEDDLR